MCPPPNPPMCPPPKPPPILASADAISIGEMDIAAAAEKASVFLFMAVSSDPGDLLRPYTPPNSSADQQEERAIDSRCCQVIVRHFRRSPASGRPDYELLDTARHGGADLSSGSS